MLDERWSPDVEEVAVALRRMLATECSPERVRAAEAHTSGRDEPLEAQLRDFGLNALEGEAELFARAAFELGRALAPTDHVECMPVLALTGRPGHALVRGGLAPAAARYLAVVREGGVYAAENVAAPRKTTAGDALVRGPGQDGDRIGDAVLGGRLERYAALVESARLVGAAQALLAYGVGYVQERQQFGKPIGAYQAVAHRLARVTGELDAAELLVRKAAFAASPHVGGDGAPPQHFAWMVQAKAIEAARFAATNVHQVFGGNGFAMEYDVQLYSRRLRSWSLRVGRPGDQLASLARLVLDPARRDAMKLLWQYESGMPLPRWAREADQPTRV